MRTYSLPMHCSPLSKKIRHVLAMAGALTLSTTATLTANAAEIATDPGDYVPLPEGSTLGLLYLQHASRDSVYANGDLLRDDTGLDTRIGLARFIHYLDIGGYTVNPQIILPFGRVELKAPFGPLEPTSSSGMGDPMIGATTWLVNNPDQQKWFGLSAFASMPAGKYDASNGPINVGENRWKGIFQAGYVTGLGDDFMLDIIAEYATYGDNDDFIGTRREQNDSQSLQTHFKYLLSPQSHLALSYYHSFGGETTVGGVRQDDALDNSRWQATFATFVQPTLQLQMQYGQDINVENGFKEDQRINLRVAKVF